MSLRAGPASSDVARGLGRPRPRPLVVLGVVLALLGGGAVARAGDAAPDVWSRVRDREAGERARLHREVHAWLRAVEAADGSPAAQVAFRELMLAKAREELERAGAEKSPSVLLRFDLGMVYEGVGRYADAVRVLEAALRDHPRHPAAASAYWHLAISYAKLDRPADEGATYVRYLAHATAPEERAVALLNFAETEMRLGRLPEAIEGYRVALDHAKYLTTDDARRNYILAQWGLAVALDRYGDASAAAREAAVADRLDDLSLGGMRRVLQGRNVFFVPEYERSWYLGLGAVAHARASTDPRVALHFAERAESHFADYVARASQATAPDLWLELAKKRLAAATKERKRLGGRVAKSAPLEESEAGP